MLALDADARPTCSEILKHRWFTQDGFDELFVQELRAMILRENEKKPLNRLSAKLAEENAAKKRMKKEAIQQQLRKVNILVANMVMIGCWLRDTHTTPNQSQINAWYLVAHLKNYVVSPTISQQP